MKNLKIKKKCFLSFLSHISYFFIRKLYFVFYLLRKKKYYLNLGFFLPKISNISNNEILYRNMLSLEMEIPFDFRLDFIRSKIGRVYFKLFFKFLNGITHFSYYFFSLYKQFQKIIRKRLRYKLYSRKHSRYFLRFFNFNVYEKQLIELQKTFNYFHCNKKIKTTMQKIKLFDVYN